MMIFDWQSPHLSASLRSQVQASIGRAINRPMKYAYNKSWGRVGGYVMDRINKAGAPLAPLGNMPEQQKYLAERYRALGKVADTQKIATSLYNAFRKVDADTRDQVYKFLTDKTAAPGTITDPKARADALRAKREIEEVGQKLVNAGLLDKATFEKHRGEYLPRIYLRHLLDEGTGRGGGSERSTSNLGYLKQRKDIPKDIRELILGEIQDPAFLASRAVGRPLRDLAILDFLDFVAQGKEWNFAPGMVDWGGKKVSAQWLQSEIDAITRQIPHMRDPALRDAAGNLTKAMEARVKPAIDATGKVPKDFRQVPDSPRYGRMRGMWVRKEIHNDVVGGARFLASQGGIAEKISWATAEC